VSVILSINRGSSSLKFALYRIEGDGENEQLLARGEVEDIGDEQGVAWMETGRDSRRERRGVFPDSQSAVSDALSRLEAASLPRPQAIGHRLVHGGPRHLAPERLTKELIADLRQSIAFAPLHLPIELETIEAIGSKFASVHRSLPSTPAFIATCPKSHDVCRSRNRYRTRACGATAFTAFHTNTSCSAWVRGRRAGS